MSDPTSQKCTSCKCYKPVECFEMVHGKRVSFPGPVLDEDEQEGDESIVFLRQRAAELRRLAEIFEAQADTGQQGIASPIWRNSMMRRDVGRDAAQVVEDEGHNRSRDRTWEGTERRQNTMGYVFAEEAV
ncbi:hypothetical protein DFH09DRAFT_1071642 [Mycena vulgaris]|nr:hypothetical protein DFH09DRAFT_1071642 [Mycena vulgaris]